MNGGTRETILRQAKAELGRVQSKLELILIQKIEQIGIENLQWNKSVLFPMTKIEYIVRYTVEYCPYGDKL